MRCEVCNYKCKYMSEMRRHYETKKHNSNSPDKKMTSEEIKEEINKYLLKCINQKIDPNKYFCYGYYASNINELTDDELKCFLEEFLLLFDI